MTIFPRNGWNYETWLVFPLPTKDWSLANESGTKKSEELIVAAASFILSSQWENIQWDCEGASSIPVNTSVELRPDVKLSPWQEFERAGTNWEFFSRGKRGGREDCEQSRCWAVTWAQVCRSGLVFVYLSACILYLSKFVKKIRSKLMHLYSKDRVNLNLCNRQTSMEYKIPPQFHPHSHTFHLGVNLGQMCSVDTFHIC